MRVVGDRRQYIAALVPPGHRSVHPVKQRRGKPGTATVSGLREDPGLWRTVTPTQEVCRDYVLAKYASEIDALYS